MKQNWEYKKLGEVCDIYQPKTISSDKLIENGRYKVYGANGTIGFYNEYNHIEKEILLTCRGATCGTINVSEPYSWINGNAMVIHRKDNTIDFSFLKYHMLQIDYSLIITGAAQPQITRQMLSPVSIVIPPLPQQQAIVAELDKINEVIDLKKAQLKDLDLLAQSIFYNMFGDPIENPKGWDVKKLGEIGTIITGSTPSTSDSSNWDGYINWVTPAELGDQLYYGETKRKLTEKGAKGLTMMPKGTVLLSSRAPIGKLAITTESMCCNQGFKNIICGKDIVNVYVYYYLMLTMDSIKELGVGATFKEVSKKSITTYNIVLPPLPLQQEFAKKIEAIETQKAAIKQSLAEAETLLASRMDYWFN